MTPIRRSNEQQRRDIHARDEEEDACGSKQPPRRVGKGSDEVFNEGLKPDAEFSVGLRVFPAEPSLNHCKVGIRLCQRDSWLEPTDDRVPGSLAKLRQSSERDRRPHV